MKAAYEPTDEECEWKADEEEELTVRKQGQMTNTPACLLYKYLAFCIFLLSHFIRGPNCLPKVTAQHPTITDFRQLLFRVD